MASTLSTTGSRLVFSLISSLCLLIPLTSAASTTITKTGSTADATFLYPTSTPTINNIDTLDVTYDTDWKAANLTIYCYVNPTTDVYNFYSIQNNPIDASGTYIFNDIQSGLNINQFPVACHMMLTEFQHEDNYINGAIFTMTSTQGAVSTYQISTVTTGIAKQTNTATGTATVGEGTGSGMRPTSTSTSTSTSTAGSDSSSSSLSTGADVGIAVGTAAIAVGVAAVVWYMIRTRRRNMRSTEGLCGLRQGMEKDHNDYEGIASGKPAPLYEVGGGTQQQVYESGGSEAPVELGTTNSHSQRPYRYELGA